MSNNLITLAHGSGGTRTREIVELFRSYFDNPFLNPLDDSAILGIRPEDRAKRIAFTTDSYVVSPIFFPGGDIGKLAIAGTINDLACLGAVPHFISAGFIIEEGLPLSELEAVIQSMARTAKDCNVVIAAGDTKVVGKGQADKLFINTSGVGVVPEGVNLGAHLIKPGDRIILTGTLGDHSIAITMARENLPISGDIRSDCQPLHRLVQKVLEVGKEGVHAIRDVTRGGLATILKELAVSSTVNMLIYEEKVPISAGVMGVCQLLGFDPLHLACEGKMVIMVSEERAQDALNAVRGTEEGKNAEIIGFALTEKEIRGINIQGIDATILMQTRVGGLRVVEPPSGELLPRIC